MRRVYIILLLCIIAWRGGPGSTVLAQETTSGSQRPPYEDSTVSLSEPPTPQFFRLEADFSAAGITTVRLPRDPAWVAATGGPVIRLEQMQIEVEPTESVLLPTESEAEKLQQFLEQAIDRAPPDATPAAPGAR